MRSKFMVLISAALLSVMLAPAASAANRVPSLDVDVALRSDGSAAITQEFSAVTEEGSEFYLDCSGPTLSDFSVSDEDGPYTVLEEGQWDIDAPFEEKARKCGMLPIEGGMELCWGITKYGERRYTLKYVLHSLAESYTDADGFNYRFVNAGMNFFPTDVVVTIRNQDGTPLTDEGCDIWAFGFEGQIQFEDDIVRAWTERALEGEANITIMMRLQKGILFPESIAGGSFETVRKQALEGSDYEQGLTAWEYLIAVAGTVGAVISFLLIYSSAQKRKRRKLLENTDYFREAPCGGDLNAAFVLGKELEYCPDDSLMGARILRLITLGSLEPADPDLGEKGVLLRLAGEPHQGDAYDEALYTFLQAAAGTDDILHPQELEDFCGNTGHAESLTSIMDQCERDGRLALIRRGCFKGAVCNSIKDLTSAGQKELSELLGFKRYLLDFSLIAERRINETLLWQDCMVYAMLLGIAKQVVDQLKALYPQQLAQIEQYTRYVGYAQQYDILLYSMVEQERQRQIEAQEARFAGSGGSSSFGGGGGFSGNGGGGIR